VVVNHGDGLARRAGKGPGGRLGKVRPLRAVMCGDRADVGNILDETPAGIVLLEHSISVALRQLSNVGIHVRQSFVWYVLDLLTHRRISAHDVEIMTIKAEAVPHELGERFDFTVILGADDGVYV